MTQFPPPPPAYGPPPAFGAPPPLPYGPPPAPPKKSNTLKIVLIVVGAVVLLCVGVVAAGGYFLYRTIDSATKPVDAANAFLDNVETRHFASAYDSLCARDRHSYTEEEFSEALSDPGLASHDVTGFNVNVDNGSQTATVTATLDYRDGSVATVTFDLVHENNSWQVCNNPFNV